MIVLGEPVEAGVAVIFIRVRLFNKALIRPCAVKNRVTLLRVTVTTVKMKNKAKLASTKEETKQTTPTSTARY